MSLSNQIPKHAFIILYPDNETSIYKEPNKKCFFELKTDYWLFMTETVSFYLKNTDEIIINHHNKDNTKIIENVSINKDLFNEYILKYYNMGFKYMKRLYNPKDYGMNIVLPNMPLRTIN